MSRDFPGTAGNYLSLGANPPNLNITGTALTIHCWIWPDAGGAHVVAKDASGDRQYTLTLNGGKVEAVIGDGGSGQDVATGATSVATTRWQPIGMRKNGTAGASLTAWLDGAIDGSVTSALSIGNSTAIMGFGARNGVPSYDGRLAEVGIWAAALSDGEMVALAKGLSPLLVRPQSLRGYWPLWGTASPERDYTAFHDNATIVGTVNAGNNHPPVMPFSPHTRAVVLPRTAITQDVATVYLDLQPSSAELLEGVDSASVYLDLQASGFDVGGATTDSATAYLDLQPSGVDAKGTTDAATVYIDLQPSGTDVYSPPCFIVGSGEADLEWDAIVNNLAYAGEANSRWGASLVVGNAQC